MNIYECLCIENDLIYHTIPKELIIENTDYKTQFNAYCYFHDVNYVAIRASFNRNEHYLQVVEIQLNNADHINEISYIIQKAIKYQVLFVFVFFVRYMLLYRDFEMTQSTENVYTDNIHFCSNWIYQEILDDDFVSCYDINVIRDNYYQDDSNYNFTKYDKEYKYFKDEYSALKKLESRNNGNQYSGTRKPGNLA